MRTKLLALFLSVFGLVAGLAVSHSTSQVQAQGSCSEAPVNVQFRQWTGGETTWLEGASFAPAQGSFLDVNCFSKTGAQLLTGGKLTATRSYNGVTSNISITSWGREVRRFQLVEPGVYTFTCRNTAGSCTNTDSFTVQGTPTVSPPPASPAVTPPVVAPPATPNTPIVSTCSSISVNGGGTATVGQRVKFRCNGPANATTFFFSYRRSNTDQLQQLQTESGNLSTEIEVTPFLQVQCNPCIGTTCATADNVNRQCTYTYTQAATPPPAGGSRADLNKDGKVDILDYQIFLEEYLKFARK